MTQGEKYEKYSQMLDDLEDTGHGHDGVILGLAILGRIILMIWRDSW